MISDLEYPQSNEEVSYSQQRPDSPESQSSETTERPLGCDSQSLKALVVPVYKLAYDAEIWKLISQIHDPHYVGETYFSKTGFFKCMEQELSMFKKF